MHSCLQVIQKYESYSERDLGMEFLPLEKYSLNDKKKKPLKRGKKNIGTKSNNKAVKRSKSNASKKLTILESKKKNKSDEEGSSDEISEQTEEISTLKKNEEVQTFKLFVNMKQIIMNEQEVKELHPNVISVRFPRKKRSRWCWAIFDSEAKAAEAFCKLKKRNDIIVAKPQNQSKENANKKVKLVKSKIKKEIKSKIKEAWT